MLSLAPRSSKSEAGSRPLMIILLADDSKFMRTILKGMLTKSVPEGTEFLEAGTGTETLTLLKEKDPDLLVLDLIMPEKGGIDVLRERGKAKAKVIVVSAIGQEKVMEEATALGAVAFIVKPFDEKKVVETVRAAIGVS